MRLFQHRPVPVPHMVSPVSRLKACASFADGSLPAYQIAVLECGHSTLASFIVNVGDPLRCTPCEAAKKISDQMAVR